MKMSPAQRICAIALSVVSMFALAGFIPAPQPSGASSTAQVSTTSQITHAALVATSLKPRWYAPVIRLPNQPVIRCILYRESRSTYARPNLGDVNPYQFGPFQFTPILWNRWAWVAGVGRKSPGWYLGTTTLNAVTIPAYKSTLYQQSEVFVTVVRNDGLGMWIRFDGC